MRFTLRLGMAMLLLLAVASLCQAQTTDIGWSRFMCDNRNTGYSPNSTGPNIIGLAPSMLWQDTPSRYPFPDAPATDADIPVITADGSIVYYGTLNAVDADTGLERWDPSVSGCTSPILDGSGNIYLGYPTVDKYWDAYPSYGTTLLASISRPNVSQCNRAMCIGPGPNSSQMLYTMSDSGQTYWPTDVNAMAISGSGGGQCAFYRYDDPPDDDRPYYFGDDDMSPPVMGMAVAPNGEIYVSGCIASSDFDQYIYPAAVYVARLSWQSGSLVRNWAWEICAWEPSFIYDQDDDYYSYIPASAPVITSDGTAAYLLLRKLTWDNGTFSTCTDYLAKVSSSGTKMWSGDGIALGTYTGSCPRPDGSGIAIRETAEGVEIYAGVNTSGNGSTGKLAKYLDDGTCGLCWEYTMPAGNVYPTVGSNGVVYTTSSYWDTDYPYAQNGYIIAFTPDGSPMWQCNKPGAGCQASISGDRLFVPLKNGGVIALGYDVTPTAIDSIGDLADSSNGASVYIGGIGTGSNGATGRVVTRTLGSSDFYIEEDDGSSGIRVYWQNQVTSALQGKRVAVYGQLCISAGAERYISATNVVEVGSGAIEPVGMRNNWLGGEYIGTAYGISQPSASCDLYNLGLLVESWGKVTEVGSDYLIINDGSDLANGGSTLGVKVRCYGFSPTQSVGAYVLVTGISSMDSGYRVVKVNDSSDIQTLQASTTTCTMYANNLISLPKVPVNPAPADVFASVLDSVTLDGNLYRWDGCTQGLGIYDEFYPPSFGNILYGDGYWLNNLTQNDTLQYQGVDVADCDQWISLPSAGWTYAGFPLSANVALADMKVTNGRETVSFTDAVLTKGWIECVSYYWNAAVGGLVDVGPEDCWCSESAMSPWHGWQIESNVDGLALIIPNP